MHRYVVTLWLNVTVWLDVMHAHAWLPYCWMSCMHMHGYEVRSYDWRCISHKVTGWTNIVTDAITGWVYMEVEKVSFFDPSLFSCS